MKRVTFACEDSQGLEAAVSGHFGRCPYYTHVDLDAAAIKQVSVIENPHYDKHVPGQVPRFINEQKTNVMIAGGMGPMAIDLFGGFGIEVCTGVSGTVRDVLAAYFRGQVSGAAACAHDHEDSCGGHGH